MLLAIDSGNTNIVFSVFDAAGAVLGEWRSSAANVRTADEFGVWLTQLMGLAGIDYKAIDAAIIATVVPANLFDLKTLCSRYFGCQALVIGDPAVDLGIEVLVDNPEEVGADRLVNAVGGHINYKGDLIVLDFGTATTFDVVDAGGNYRGGVIAPGINLSIEALHQAAAKLPRIAIRRPEKVIGTGTITAMQSGVFYGYVGMIEGMVARIKAEYNAPMTVIATGGLAALFDEATKVIDAVEPHLTLFGLYAIYRRNTG
ncbi:MAG: type III pantothenate kinase [Magnetospiraceae bacterium]